MTFCIQNTCGTGLTAVSTFSAVGTTPKYLLNASSYNNSNISISSLVITASMSFSLFGTQSFFLNVSVYGLINTALNFSGWLVTYSQSSTFMSCLTINVSINASSGYVYLLQ